ncbi:MAG: hypothetical protein E7289_06375 [Lachnospiraceae bacterium]|nr:hypothetical protein [Lachnospiraceae bacterium]
MDKLKGLGLAVVGAVLIFVFAIPQYKILQSPAQDIYEINANEITEGTHITGNIDFIYDYYATESREEKTLGITTSTENDTSRWYIFPVYGESVEDPKYLTVRVSPEDYYTVDKIVEETWAYLNGEADSFGQTTYAIDARAVKLDDELLQLYYDWYGAEYKAEAEEYLTPYVLVPVTEMNIILIMGVLGIVLIIAGLVMLLWKKKKVEPNYTPETYTPETYTPETYDRYK